MQGFLRLLCNCGSKMHNFKAGDIVQLTNEAAQKSKFPDRPGTVIAIRRPSSQISILWYETKTPQLMHFSLLRHARTAIAEEPRTEEQEGDA